MNTYGGVVFGPKIRRLALLACAMLLLAACGDDDSTSPTTEASGTRSLADVSLASAIRIDDHVDARVGTTDFVGVGEPVAVAVGDLVRTDTTGFAEISYFDGSVTRLDVETEFEVLALADAPDAAEIRTRMGLGRTWHRVQALTGNDAYVVETNVATATVRGTAFVITCSADGCTFEVLEGTVVVMLPDGTEIELSAGERLRVGTDGADAPNAIDPGLIDDAWIVRNLGLDTDGGAPALESAPTGPGDGGGEVDPDIDPCAFFDQPSVEAILGRAIQVVEPKDLRVRPIGAACLWDAGFVDTDSGSYRVYLQLDLISGPLTETQGGCDTVPVTDLGDAADLTTCPSLAGGPISYVYQVQTGDVTVTLWVQPDREVSPAEVRIEVERILAAL